MTGMNPKNRLPCVLSFSINWHVIPKDSINFPRIPTGITYRRSKLGTAFRMFRQWVLDGSERRPTSTHGKSGSNSDRLVFIDNTSDSLLATYSYFRISSRNKQRRRRCLAPNVTLPRFLRLCTWSDFNLISWRSLRPKIKKTFCAGRQFVTWVGVEYSG